jgi:aspartate kinase
MTYWGAKVLQYRSVEIAKHFQIPLYVGPAHSHTLGTFITEKEMIEDSELLALNSHETVLQIRSPKKSLSGAIDWFKAELEKRKIIFPQLLHSEIIDGLVELFITGPKEVLEDTSFISDAKGGPCSIRELSSVTATCRGSTRIETMEKVIGSLECNGVPIRNFLVSAMSVTVFVEKALRTKALQLLHSFVPIAEQTQPSQSSIRRIQAIANSRLGQNKFGR